MSVTELGGTPGPPIRRNGVPDESVEAVTDAGAALIPPPAETEPLARVAAIAAALGAGESAADALALAQRVAEGRFFVACVGAFKRGKSTLMNALVGRPVLPTGIVPVTAVPTVLRHGETPHARVRGRAGLWEEIPLADLVEYVSEERNPGNARGVSAVEVFLPVDLLAAGISLVDTPGLGSIFASASDATTAFIPHVDAALLVTGVDPPLAGDELALLTELAAHVPDIIVVVNKADRHAPDDVARAVAFAERAVARVPGLAHRPDVLCLSAVNALGRTSPAFDWPRLLERLRALAERSGRALVRAAADRGLRRVIASLRREIEVQRSALTHPIDVSARRAETLRAMSEDVAHRRLVLGHLFAAEEEGLQRALDAERAAFRAEVEREAVLELAGAFGAIDVQPRRGPARRRLAMEAVREIARRRLMPWFAHASARGESLYRDIGRRYVAAANDYLERLAAADPDALGDAFADAQSLDPEAGFRARSGFYYTDMMTVGSPVAPGAWLLDVLAPRAVTTRRIHRDARRYLERLLEVNTSRVVGDIRDRVLESRRGLEAEVQRLLRGVHQTAVRALEQARATQAGGTEAVRGAVDRLDALQRQLDALAGAEDSTG